MADKDLHSALYSLTHPYMDVVMLDAIEAGELAQLIVDMHAAHAETDAKRKRLIAFIDWFNERTARMAMHLDRYLIKWADFRDAIPRT